MELDDVVEGIYVLDQERCGKCNNLCYLGGNYPFSCCDGMTLPRYVNRNFMSNCQNFSKRTKTSVIVPSNFDVKELEAFCKVSKR